MAVRSGGHQASQLELLTKYIPPPPEGMRITLNWGRRDYATEMLGAAFDLEFFDGQSPERGESPEWLWEMSSTSIGPIKATLASLDADQAQLRADFIEDRGRYRTADGTMAMPREYLIILGHRKTR